MRDSRKRLVVAAAVVVMSAATVRTLADQVGSATLNVYQVETIHLDKKDTSKCGHLKYYCDRTCEESPYTGVGLCRDDQTGETSAISVVCCCCTEGSQHRSYLGG